MANTICEMIGKVLDHCTEDVALGNARGREATISALLRTVTSGANEIAANIRSANSPMLQSLFFMHPSNCCASQCAGATEGAGETMLLELPPHAGGRHWMTGAMAEIGNHTGEVCFFSPPDVMQVTAIKFPGVWSLSSPGFTTACLNKGVASGRWMYEVTLHTDGLIQIGWTPPPQFFPWDNKFGVGDFPFTYSYDGYRQYLWNVTPTTCGPRWAAGDTISCLLDLEVGSLSFHLNGCEVVTQAVPIMSNSPPDTPVPLVYFPALSLVQNESCVVNLGTMPFKFPVPGYRGIEGFNPCVNARWFGRMFLVASAGERQVLQPYLPLICAAAVPEVNDPAKFASVMCGAMSTLCTMHKMVRNPEEPMRRFMLVLSNLMTPEIRKYFVSLAMAGLCFKSSTRLLTTTAHVAPTPELEMLRLLIDTPGFCETWCESCSFSHDMLNIFRIKPPNNSDIEHKVFPDAERAELVAEEIYCQSIRRDDECRKYIVAQLLKFPSSTAKVHQCLDLCIRDLRDRPRAMPVPLRRHSPFSIDSALICRLFFALCDVLGRKAGPSDTPRSLVNKFCPPHVIANETIENLVLPRFGGQWSHVSRTTAYKPVPDPTFSKEGGVYSSLLLKAAILYVAGAKVRILEACESVVTRQRLRDSGTDAAASTEGKKVLRRCAWDSATLFQAQEHKSLMTVCSIIARIVLYYQSDDGAGLKFLPTALAECFIDVLNLCRRTSVDFAAMLGEAPECVVFFLKLYMHPDIVGETGDYIIASVLGVLDTSEEHRNQVVAIMKAHPHDFQRFLCCAFSLFGHQLNWTSVTNTIVRFNFGNAFCSNDIDADLITWNTIFPHRLQCTQQAGRPSPVSHLFYADAFRRYVKEKWWATDYGPDCNGNEGKVAIPKPEEASIRAFVKNLLAHTNFAITELGAALHETKQMASGNCMPYDLGVHRRRTSGLFIITEKLLHIVEWLVEVAFEEVFSCEVEGSAMTTRMVVEVLSQSLCRFADSSATSSLNCVVALKLRGLERIVPARLVAPLVGILWSITRGGTDLDEKNNKFLMALASPEAAWSIGNVEYALRGFNWAAIESRGGCCVSKSHFALSDDVHNCFLRCDAAKSQGTQPLADDDCGAVEDGVCLICALHPIDTSFQPCGHTSCEFCIRRYLLGSEKCFFCNKRIEGLVTLPSTATVMSD